MARGTRSTTIKSTSRAPKAPRSPSIKSGKRPLAVTARNGKRNVGSQLISGGALIPSVKTPKGAKVASTGRRGTASSGKAPSGYAPHSPALPKGNRIG